MHVHKPNYIPVFVGDRVIVSDLPTWWRKKEMNHREGIVTAVTPRYGLVNNKSRAQLPVISVQFDDNGETEFFDNSFVSNLIQRHTTPNEPINYCRGELQKSNLLKEELLAIKTSHKGILCGTLLALAKIEMAKLPWHLPHPIDEQKLALLYARNPVGIINRGEFGFGTLVYVHKKQFAKWIRKNAFRICKTSVQLRAEETTYHREWELMMEEDMDRLEQESLDREFDEERYNDYDYDD
jgi:hypothetical protein